MITVSEKTRAKVENAAGLVSEYAEISKSFSETLNEGKAPEENLTSELLELKARSIRDGEFKIVVCGKFKNGKSTFVNALLEREIMAAKATACTAVIAVVNKGDNENEVTVIYTNGDRKTLSIEEFTRDFQLTEEEQEQIDALAENDEEIVFDRFADIDHVEMQSRHPMFESGCSLIDTPGLEEAISRDKTTNEFLPKADAIVFMLNALSLFSKEEKRFIAEHFEGKHKNNVFFVVNRINQLSSPDQLENQIIPSVKTTLKSCFTDENGEFDEELFNRRVFYVNAYGALCALTDQMIQVNIGGIWQKFPIDINTTGLPEYEAAQMAFIDSEERTGAVFTSALDLLISSYNNALNDTRAKLNAISMDSEKRAATAKKANEALEEAEKVVAKISEAFTRFGTVASNALFLDLMNYFDKSIKGEFPAHIKNEITAKQYKARWQIVDGLLNAISLLPIDRLRKKAEEITKQHLQPLADDLDAYIKRKMELWQTQNRACIRTYEDDLTEELNDLCDQFELHINASVEAFSGPAPSEKTTGAKGMLQTAIAVFLGKDMSTVVDISNSGGSISWGQLAGKYLTQVIIDNVLMVIAPEAVLLKFGIDALIIAVRARASAQKKALAMGEGALEKYKATLKQNELSFKQGVIDNINKTKDKVSETANKELEQKKENVKRLSEENTRTEAEQDELRTSLVNINNKMYSKIEDMFELINGRKPQAEELRQAGLAAQSV